MYMLKYYKRITDKVLENTLKLRGAVLIEGIKWCGKTTTAKQKALSVIDLSMKKEADRAELMVYEDAEKLFSISKPILIDEWQKVPAIWDSLRNQIDNHQEIGSFILTGSTSQTKAIESLRMHSGLGRIGRIKLLTMSLWESQDSNGEVSLGNLFGNQEIPYSDSPNNLNDIAFLCIRGGWPAILKTDKKLAEKQASLYLEELCESDIRTVDGHRRSAEKMKRILRSYARFTGSNAPNTSIENDINDISKNTLYDYLKVLEDLFVTNETTAWNPNFRSATAIQSSNTRYFTDPSITAAALGMGENDLLNDIETFGLVFETLVVRDLKVYAQMLDADIFHYRDSSGLECDAVIHCKNGKYALVEVKLSQAREEEGAKTLKSLKTKLEKANLNPPTFLMVITATGFAHKREDGVFVVPIGCLKD
jgi:uncharacterized protein